MKKRGKKKTGNRLGSIILTILIIAIIGGCGYYFFDKKIKEIEANKLKVTLKDNKKIEINSEVKYSNLVSSLVNGTLINGDEAIDTSKLGDIKVVLVFKNKDDIEEKKDVIVKVVDTQVPVIEGKKEFTLYIGNDINLLDGASVSDNSKEEIKIDVVGDYDKNNIGTYNLKYVAVDSSGNKGEFEFVLNVISDPNNRTFTTSKGFSGRVVNGVTYIDGVLIANKSYSLPSDYGPGLIWETQNAFYMLRNDAAYLGYNLIIGSGYRSYYTQQTLYNNYAARDGYAAADRYSARAGYSEHQTGLAFDVCDNDRLDVCVNSGFDDTDQARWISDNCYKYGLILRYPYGKEDITGYMYESWHLRYVGVDLATKLYNGGNWITLEEYFGIDSKYS